MDVLYRHWAMLRMIPRQPRKIDGATIESRLRDEGYETTRRTIQRDLEKLSTIFPLISDDRSKPYGWSWGKEAQAFDLPGMEPAAALTFRLVEQYLAQLIPVSARRALQP